MSTYFWGDLNAANKQKIRSDQIDTFEQIISEIDSHLVLLDVQPSVNIINWNAPIDVMVENIQEMKKVDRSITFFRSITDVSDQKM